MKRDVNVGRDSSRRDWSDAEKTAGRIPPYFSAAPRAGDRRAHPQPISPGSKHLLSGGERANSAGGFDEQSFAMFFHQSDRFDTRAPGGVKSRAGLDEIAAALTHCPASQGDRRFPRSAPSVIR